MKIEIDGDLVEVITPQEEGGYLYMVIHPMHEKAQERFGDLILISPAEARAKKHSSGLRVLGITGPDAGFFLPD